MTHWLVDAKYALGIQAGVYIVFWLLKPPLPMTRIEIIGFTIELMMFAVSVYLYLYFTNIITTKNRTKRKQQEEFIRSYGSWMRPLSLVLMAIMTVNILLRLVN